VNKSAAATELHN